MSGIAGIYQLDGQSADVELLGRMTSALFHRGPDALGTWNDGEISLGHCMLFTTPESLHEVQPLQQAGENGAVITFDGRLDNRIELRSLLSSKGFAAKTDTDSELVLNAYLCWGERCPEQILGDFAFAIWDSQKRRLFCAKDHMGVKPFYYYIDNRKFIFCSEIQPLLKCLGMNPQANLSLIEQFMRGDFSERVFTFYSGIYKVPPAHFLAVNSDGSTRLNRYWNIDPEAKVRYSRPEGYAEHFLEIFREAVKCRLRVTGPVGFLLSGGLDSTSVVCTAQTLQREGLVSDYTKETFSAISNDSVLTDHGESFDEQEYIESVFGKYDIPHNYYLYEDQTPKGYYEVASNYLDVLYTPTLALFVPIARDMKDKGIKVLIDGLGGDDILGSEPDAYLYRYADLIKQAKFKEFAGDLRMALKYYPIREVLGLCLKYGAKPLINSLTKPRSRPQTPPSRSGKTRMSSIFQEEMYQSLILRDETTIAIEDVDKFFSHSTIEARHPFFDVRLVEFALAIPPEQLSRKYQTKLILRRSMKGILPEVIRRRSTVTTFTSVVSREIRELYPREFQQLIDSPTLLEGIDWRYVRRIFRDYCVGNQIGREHVGNLVMALGLELWHRTSIQTDGG